MMERSIAEKVPLAILCLIGLLLLRRKIDPSSRNSSTDFPRSSVCEQPHAMLRLLKSPKSTKGLGKWRIISVRCCLVKILLSGIYILHMHKCFTNFTSVTVTSRSDNIGMSSLSRVLLTKVATPSLALLAKVLFLKKPE